MRQQDHLLILQKSLVDLRFFLVDVQAHRGDGAVFEGGDEGGFVDDGPARRIDDDDARFHEGELGGGEEVVGMGLRRGVSGVNLGGSGRGGKELRGGFHMGYERAWRVSLQEDLSRRARALGGTSAEHS